jgi:gluconokinase
MIGIDIGTTHCKGVSLTVEGKLIFEKKLVYSAAGKLNEENEQDPDSILNSVLELLQEIIKVDKNKNLLGISFSAAMHGLMVIDKKGNPMTPIFTWADSRSKEYATYLLQQPLAEEIYKNTGLPIHPMSPLCKIIWLRNEMPLIFQQAYKFLSIKEYFFYKLFGEFIVDYSMASATGLFDIHKLIWYEEALSIAGIRNDQLSKPINPQHFESELKEEYQKLLGISNNIPFYIGGSDGCLAQLGCGAINAGEGSLTIGTSGAIRILTTNPGIDKGSRLFCYALSNKHWVAGGPINNGGIILKWFAENILKKPLQSAAELEWFSTTAQHSPAGSGGLIFLPYILGERAPMWDPDACGVFFGLRALHHQQHMMRAIMEGISYALYDVMHAMEETYGTVETLYATGGFIESEFWLQMLADILNKKIIVHDYGDASAIGACFFAMYVNGIMKDFGKIKDFIPLGKTFYPDNKTHKLYGEYISIFLSLYPKLKEDFKKLNNFGDM